MPISTLDELETALNSNQQQISTTGDAAAFLNWTDDSRIKLSHWFFKYSAAQGLQDRVKAAQNYAKNEYGTNVRDQEMRKIVLDHYNINLTPTNEIDLVRK